MKYHHWKGQSHMVTNKTQAVLLMYDALLRNGRLCKKDYLSILEISDISFKRYISELRCYFMNFAPQYELAYDRKQDTYLLIKG
jgi:hypothetical protein